MAQLPGPTSAELQVAVDRQVALPSASCPLGFVRRINVEHYSRHFRPIGTLSISIEHTHIGDEMSSGTVTTFKTLGS
jgi:hypothetical protein